MARGRMVPHDFARPGFLKPFGRTFMCLQFRHNISRPKPGKGKPFQYNTVKSGYLSTELSNSDSATKKEISPKRRRGLGMAARQPEREIRGGRWAA